MQRHYDFSEQIERLSQIDFARSYTTNFSDIMLKINGYPFYFSADIFQIAQEGKDVTLARLETHDELASSSMNKLYIANLVWVASFALNRILGWVPYMSLFTMILSGISLFFRIHGSQSFMDIFHNKTQFKLIETVEQAMNDEFSDDDIKKLSKLGAWFNITPTAKLEIYVGCNNPSEPYRTTSYESVCFNVYDLHKYIEKKKRGAA